MSYSPKIKPELVRELYRLKHSNERRIPMTRLVNEAVEQYLNKIQILKQVREEENNNDREK